MADPPRNPIAAPSRLPLVAASILSADFADLGDACARVLAAGADLLHLDVMDGHFVPNLTMGPDLCAGLRRRLPDAALDVHLMVTDPADFIRPFADAGADHLTVHVEANGAPADLAAAIHEAGCTAGIAINPETPLDAIGDDLDAFDLVLVMSVHPGFAGQRFIDDVLPKTEAARTILGPERRVQMDGGVNAGSADRCRAAGCDVLVAASAIFGAEDWADAIGMLRGSASSPVAGGS